MLPWLLIPVLAASLQSPPVRAVSPSSGPASKTEARLLWKEGQAAFEGGDYPRAIHELERLVHRYPGQEGHLEAHLLLGRAYLYLKDASKAVAPLKYYATATRKAAAPSQSPENSANPVNDAPFQGRLWLGRAYLGAHKPQEAYFTALEAEKSVVRETQTEALLLRARALFELKQETRAQKALSSAQTLLKSSARPELRGEAAWLEMTMKLRACTRLPSQRTLSEAQARDQLNRRGDCLLEALPSFRATLQAGERTWAEAGGDDLGAAFAAYGSACRNPPSPPEKRTTAELKRYKAELADLLKQECGERARRAAEFLAGWEEKDPLPPGSREPLKKALEALRFGSPS